MMLEGNPEVVQELRTRIGRNGRITFAEFMAVALYWPRGGYYASRLAVGAEGDFYSAPTLHPAFGALVARQLHETWLAMGKTRPFRIVELGAGTGQLAADITACVRDIAAELAGAMRYVAVDVHAPAVGHDPFDWVVSSALPFRGVRGCVLANELLDAMPVHRVTVERGELRELYVSLDEAGHFDEVAGQPSSPVLRERLESLGTALAEGFRAEINLGLEGWVAGVADALDEGYLLLFDYGHDAEAYYDSSRARGTLRCYHRHTLNANPYRHVGEQDISVHVEMTSLRRIAEGYGLELAGDTSQAAFLNALGLQSFRAELSRRPGLGAVERTANLRALDTLVDPDGMGAFRVLAFRKGAPAGPLQGFGGEALLDEHVPAPLATPRHVAYVGEAAGTSMPTWDDLLGGGA